MRGDNSHSFSLVVLSMLVGLGVYANPKHSHEQLQEDKDHQEVMGHSLAQHDIVSQQYSRLIELLRGSARQSGHFELELSNRDGSQGTVAKVPSSKLVTIFEYLKTYRDANKERCKDDTVAMWFQTILDDVVKKFAYVENQGANLFASTIRADLESQLNFIASYLIEKGKKKYSSADQRLQLTIQELARALNLKTYFREDHNRSQQRELYRRVLDEMEGQHEVCTIDSAHPDKPPVRDQDDIHRRLRQLEKENEFWKKTMPALLKEMAHRQEHGQEHGEKHGGGAHGGGSHGAPSLPSISVPSGGGFNPPFYPLQDPFGGGIPPWANPFLSQNQQPIEPRIWNPPPNLFPPFKPMPMPVMPQQNSTSGLEAIVIQLLLNKMFGMNPLWAAQSGLQVNRYPGLGVNLSVRRFPARPFPQVIMRAPQPYPGVPSTFSRASGTVGRTPRAPYNGDGLAIR
ncbi:MAG: hypothetical protein HY537_07425 [Deltaproteobacteria bacterium]|nr:hypothetical protein [Deltaproteobacteria bacterium]